MAFSCGLIVVCMVIGGFGNRSYAQDFEQKLQFWDRMAYGSEGADYRSIVRFIELNPDWPRRHVLEGKAEQAMPDSLSARDVIAWFDKVPPKTARGLDLYLAALMSTGAQARAQDILGKWWGDITLSRDDQKMIYRKYHRLITRGANQRRLDTLLFSKQYSNARGIANVLGGGFPALAEARIALAENKSGASALIEQVPASLQNDPGLLYERLHWRRENKMNRGAVALLNAAPPADQLQNPDAWWLERHIIIRRLLEENKYQGAYVLASNHRQVSGLPYAQAEWMAGWLALDFLGQPRVAYEHFRNMHGNVKTPISKARAAYWAGLAAEEVGSVKAKDLSYKLAANAQTTFYGQLAGVKIGVGESLPHRAPPNLTAQDRQDFSRDDLVQAARYYHGIGDTSKARLFLQAFVNKDQNSNARGYRFAIEVAKSYGLQSTALRFSKAATRKGYFLTAQSYPVITQYLGGVDDVEWALIHALIRQESLFDVDARSHAGARGLMQLMPATAKETARKLGVSHQTEWLTTRPEHNIMLGASYISQMLKRYDGAYPLAIAAYNAGPGRVDKWLQVYGDPRQGEIDWVDWVELIPIYETRNYVQRVLEAVYIYRLRLKGAQPVVDVPIHVALFVK